MAKVRQKQRQTNTTRFLEAPFVRMLCMRSASLKKMCDNKSRLYLIKPWMYETMLSDNETRERKTEIPWKTAEMTK